MPFEIIIEGPFTAISQLNRRLDSFSPIMKKIAAPHHESREKGRIVILEPSQDHLDEKLLYISRVATETSKALSLESEFYMGARNLAYSEPSSGSSQFTEHFNPIPSLTIQPWTPELTEPKDPYTIILDPHHAFGTGKHPTTLLCLRIMDLIANDSPQAKGMGGCRVLDFGCGTGLLAIAAVKMGAQRAVGVEIDPPSARAARNNVALNNLSHKVSILEGSWERVHERYDFIFANLVAAVLLRVGKHIRGHLAHAGTAVISGFGENQTEEIKRLFEEEGLTVSKQFTLEGWGALTANLRIRGSSAPNPGPGPR